ncbi:DEAD/DEAH box helicase [Brevundimonas sp.]|uniref:DEAD/DEAH box helicase n=1 Tax=Brevundimonas sp. TaxID=1871086 RepID=UPI002898F099|nr:DEAD/DEAH box helicase [Brevundimonas sp.]
MKSSPAETDLSATGQQVLVDGPAPQTDDSKRWKMPAAAVAAGLVEMTTKRSQALVFIATSERRADEIAAAISPMVKDAEVLVLPPWDCLPYDRAAPSRESMGRRMAVLAALNDASASPVFLVASPDAIVQRTPSRDRIKARLSLSAGEALDREALESFLTDTGYAADERVDEPGEYALLGAVVDVFPPASATPYRIAVDEADRITEIHAFDPVSQRRGAEIETICLTPAAEWSDRLSEDDDPDGQDTGPSIDAETSTTLFDFLDNATILTDVGVEDRFERIRAHVAEAYDTRLRFSEGVRPPKPDSLYLTEKDLRQALDGAKPLSVEGWAPTPAFALEKSPGRALKQFIAERREAGDRIVLTGLPHEHRIILRLLRRHGIDAPAVLENWSAIAPLQPGQIAVVTADLDTGFRQSAAGLVVLTPSDIFGGRIARGSFGAIDAFGDTELRLGDVVIHEDHGLGVLKALEGVVAEGEARDVLRIEYHGGGAILAPIEEFGKIWRYGSEPDAVSLDRLNTQGWLKRRAKVSAQIDEAAAALSARAEARAALRTEPITPPRQALARFAAGFAFPETPDQAQAIDAVLTDLGSGKPMNRLVCGDVGFGKTEVALRAAAAVALAGKQVIVVAPTTVLARQHFEVFRKRFKDEDVQIGHLSRAADAAEARAVKTGLADGSMRIVVGTQALASEGLAFSNLGLVIIDEEHRFGAQMKADLAQKAPHLLSMSATPIPRTLQSALVGIQDVSLIASPPARRRPIRTFMTPFDAGAVRLSLMREKARGGQSFVVVPRIDDMEPLADRLRTLTPELSVVSAHGDLGPAAIDDVMSRFSDGEGDVLLATNIIETGLDVPRANTMLIWRPDRFGLAQLHQLRGRVGRGRRQGFAYLLSDPDAPMAATTEARLQTLEALDRLGAGFAISGRDLDLRGGGDLVGEDQAGHVRLIGSALYQSVLARALAAAKGDPDPDQASPSLNVGATGGFPSDYIPDATVRINLYARLARAGTAEDVDALRDEAEDRFGPLPDPAENLFAARRLAALARDAGVTEIVSGPKATALRIADARRHEMETAFPDGDDRRWSDGRLIVEAANDRPHDAVFIERLLTELAAA